MKASVKKGSTMMSVLTGFWMVGLGRGLGRAGGEG
jgi:hypothetical protein